MCVGVVDWDVEKESREGNLVTLAAGWGRPDKQGTKLVLRTLLLPKEFRTQRTSKPWRTYIRSRLNCRQHAPAPVIYIYQVTPTTSSPA